MKKSARNNAVVLSAKYDAIEETPGVFRPPTLQEIGAVFHLTRERVRQILAAAGENINDQGAKMVQQAKRFRASLAAAHKWMVLRSGPRKGEARPEYTVYRNMLRRCLDPACPAYAKYGAVGVVICSTWLGKFGFQTFVKDMGRRPPGKFKSGRAVFSIDRIGNAPLYSKATCRWATQKQQCAPGQRRPRKQGSHGH